MNLNRFFITAVAILLTAAIPISAANADALVRTQVPEKDKVKVRPNQVTNGIRAAAERDQGRREQTSGTDDATPTTVTRPESIEHTKPVCDISAGESCARRSTCDNGTLMQLVWYENSDGTSTAPHTACLGDEAERVQPRAPTLTVGMIQSAYRDLPLPQAPLIIQPPNGKTLVNFDTIFYTTRAPFNRTITLLGHHIDFRIKPQGFTWHFGDGHQIWTTTPGKPFTNAASIPTDITHRYLLKDTYHPSLDVTYQADYRVDGKAWRPVNGTVTIQGDPRTLQALTATPHLTS